MSWILVTEGEKETQPGLRALLRGTETGSEGTNSCEYICPLKFDSAECGVSLAALCPESLVQWFLSLQRSILKYSLIQCFLKYCSVSLPH